MFNILRPSRRVGQRLTEKRDGCASIPTREMNIFYFPGVFYPNPTPVYPAIYGIRRETKKKL